MQGLVLEAPHEVVHRADLPEPALTQPGDVIVAVRRAGLCGSDLHPYEGREAVRPGVVPGHEVVGEVVRVGRAVADSTIGQRVVVPFTTSCGTCRRCSARLSSRCLHGQLFGYGDPDGDAPPLHGGQAELLRVPLADGTLVPVPRDVDDESALLLCDSLPTGCYAVERAGARGGEPLVVVGLGAVGLCAVAAARAIGVRPVVGVDPVPSRRERATLLGATAVAPEEATAATADLRLIAAVDAAGRGEAQRLAASLLEPGGVLSVIAVQTDDRFAVSQVEAYDRNLTLRVGRAPVRSLLDRLLPDLEAGVLDVPVEAVLTHPAVPLSDGADVYRRFAAREEGLVKVAFVP